MEVKVDDGKGRISMPPPPPSSSPADHDQHVIDVSSRAAPRCPSNILTFTNLTYSVKCPDRKSGHRAPKSLLNSITGEARGGETLAILGPSGAGKTTLIDALANRIARGSLRGSVTFNGEDLLQGDLLKSISAYVTQNDLLFPTLTVEETLTFAAEFRLPRALSPAEKKARVRGLVDQLGLQSAAKTIIGDDRHRGVSGGERRRVSIGVDMIHNPAILFLDEPTSGLDSSSALVVVEALRRIARGGSVVVMSVHQPSPRILGLLDRLLFISRGQTIYFGSTERLPFYFSEYGHPIPDGTDINQTEFVLDLVRELDSSATGTKLLVEFNNAWQLKTRSSPPRIVNRLDTITSTTSVYNNNNNKIGNLILFANPIWIEMLVLARRSFTNASRTPKVLGVRLAGVVFTGFILASIFWKPDDTPKGVRERVSFFVFGISTVFYACIDALPASLRERRIFVRETTHSNAYRRSSYVISGAVVGLPALVLLSAAFATTTFFAVGLAGGASGFLFFFLTIFASFWAGSSFVTFVSAAVATSHDMVAYTVAVAHLGYFLLFSGFFINRQRIPTCWKWFHYLSLVKYPYQAAVQNEFGEESRCFARGVQIFDDTVMGSMPEAVKVKALRAMSGALGTTLLTEESCMTRGLDVLKEEGVTDLSKWNCLWVTVAWGFFFRLLFYFALSLGSKNKRK